MRRCSNCFKEKPLTEFYPKLRGYQSRCKGCNAEVVYAYSARRKGLPPERWTKKGVENE
jgi:hypothetical protein